MSTSLQIDGLEDIERKQMLMGGALKASSDGILVCDKEGNIVYVNTAYENTTGLKKKRI